jgi:hypothetical protein
LVVSAKLADVTETRKWDSELAMDTPKSFTVLGENRVPHFLGDVITRDELLKQRGGRSAMKLDSFATRLTRGQSGSLASTTYLPPLTI